MTSQVLELSTDYALHHGDFVSGGFFLFNLTTGKIFKLNKESHTMLAAFDGNRRVDEVLKTMLKCYDAPEEQVSTDFSTMIDRWLEQGILVEKK